MTLITDTGALADFCARQRDAEFLTVDTEFMREHTYWPVLCLVQVGGPDEATCIDVLADGMDLEPLFELMRERSILKVFHAARQDLEIFHHLMGSLPEPLFDTQVAAMVCGFGDSVSYEQLVSKLTRGQIDKGSRFTDWSARPLSDRQITYALADVTHLRPVFEKLDEKLEKNGRRAWIDEEMAVLMDPITYLPDPMETFRRIKTRGGKGAFLSVLREVAAWREKEARRRDMPRNRILKDETLTEIAHHAPRDVNNLTRTRGLGRKLAEGPGGQQILDAVARGLAVPADERPKPISKPDLPRGIGPVTDLLKVLLKMKCEDSGVASKLLASSADIDLIAAFGEKADVRAMKGWRRDVFGNDALRLQAGELGLSVNGKRLVVAETGNGRADAKSAAE